MGHIHFDCRRKWRGPRVDASIRVRRPPLLRRAVPALPRQGIRSRHGAHGNAGAVFLRAARNVRERVGEFPGRPDHGVVPARGCVAGRAGCRRRAGAAGIHGPGEMDRRSRVARQPRRLPHAGSKQPLLPGAPDGRRAGGRGRGAGEVPLLSRRRRHSCADHREPGRRRQCASEQAIGPVSR
jgi:hypothetical protein